MNERSLVSVKDPSAGEGEEGRYGDGGAQILLLGRLAHSMAEPCSAYSYMRTT